MLLSRSACLAVSLICASSNQHSCCLLNAASGCGQLVDAVTKLVAVALTVRGACCFPLPGEYGIAGNPCVASA
jgi:hypothetical protein